MVFISEWLPNPVGNDAAGEFVELFNSGDAAMNMNGWSLRTLEKKHAKIVGVVPARGYLVLDRKHTKLVLKNSDEGIALYDAAGKLVDESKYVGSAPEGKSFNRVRDNRSLTAIIGPTMSDVPLQQFAWGKPTPGMTNEMAAVAVSPTVIPIFGVPVNHAMSGVGAFFMIMAGVAVLLTGLVVYSMKTNEDLSDIFFNRDEAVG